MSEIIEGLWDCPYCDQKGIGGLTKSCPNCGHPQDEGTKFYLGSEKRVLDKETAKNYGKGADWTCSYCGSNNRCTLSECANCGGSREESSGDYFTNQKKTQGIVANPAPKKELNVKSETPWPILLRRKILMKRLSIIAAIVVLLLAVFWPKNVTAVVQDKNWDRSIDVEVYKTVKESDWSVPAGGREYDHKQEIHHYNHVVDHYESVDVQKSREVLDGYDSHTEYSDNGDGTFTSHTVQTPRYRTEYYTETEQRPVYRDDPIYQTKYYYEIERWVVHHTVDTDGKADEPYWGEVVLEDGQREGSRREKYQVSFETKKGKVYEKEFSLEEWNRFRIGDKKKLVIQVGVIKKIKD